MFSVHMMCQCCSIKVLYFLTGQVMEKKHEHVMQNIYTFKFRYTAAQGGHKSLH